MTTAQAATPQRLPLLTALREEILPALLVLWTAFPIAFIITREEYFWPVAVWATPTVIMLWPVGRRLARSYLSYRSLLFIVGIISMAYIPAAGFVLTTDWSFEVKSAVFFGLVADLTILGIIPSFPWAISRPIRMFFRPDLLFGDGRVLCCGFIAFAFGMRYLVGPPAKEGLDWPLPVWNWWGILFAMLAGFIPLIAIRGVMKLTMRIARLRDDAWKGWGAIVLRESFLVITMLGIAYGFHTAFMGIEPITSSRSWFNTETQDFWIGLGLLLLGAFIIVVVRGGYKKIIGDPFIRETWEQTFVKEAILIAGLIPLVYGFMSMLLSDLRPLNSGPTLAIGIGSVAWGITVMTVFRVIAQVYQRRAIMGQMTAVILPSQSEQAREKVMTRVMTALTEFPAALRKTIMKTMIQALSAASPDVRAAMTGTRVRILAELPLHQQQLLMRAQAEALGELDSNSRVQTMSEMMTAVSQLPAEKRRGIMEQMSALMA